MNKQTNKRLSPRKEQGGVWVLLTVYRHHGCTVLGSLESRVKWNERAPRYFYCTTVGKKRWREKQTNKRTARRHVFLAHFSLRPIRSFRSRNSWHLGGAMYVAPGCQTLASPTVASTPHLFAPRRCSTPTRVPKPRAATGNDSTPPQNPAPFSPSRYYHITVRSCCTHTASGG